MHSPDDIRPKWLTVAQLKRVLADMPDDLRLVVNEVVQNLAVLSAEGDYVGYVDFFKDGKFEAC